jgi:methionyl aminopeptidase
MQTQTKTQSEIESMRVSGRILENVLKQVMRQTKPGMSTKDMADIAATELAKQGGKPVFLNYYGFPHVLCVSVNDEVIHGIPRANHIVKDGDILSIDFGVNYQGMITDAARTFVVGNTNSANKLLIEKTEQALLAGISVVKNNTRTGDIGSKIEAILRSAKLGIVKDYVGHGVGHELHEEPNVPNYGRSGTGSKLESGMTIAIEPMATLGSPAVSIDADGWTVRTVDGSMAAHFEDTVLITDDGFEILTRSN